MTRSFKTAAALAAAVLSACSGGAVASAQPPCADFGGAVEGDLCRVHTATPAYTVDMNFPVNYADPSPLIEYVRQTHDGFVNVAQMPGPTGPPYALDITSEQYRSGHTQSVVLKIYQNVGGAHPLTWYQAFNYDLRTHRPVTFDSLFVPGAKPLPVILPIVQKEIDQQLGSGVEIAQGAGLDPANYQNFALTDDDVIFFFGQGDLLPSAAGATVARVPRSAIAPMLA